VTAVLVVLCGVVGLVAGLAVARAAASFPWTAGPATDDPPPGPSVPAPVVVGITALLSVLAALRFGSSADLPAYLALAAAGVLLAVVDLRHRLLPNRVIGPALVTGALLLTGAAAVDDRWADLARAALGAVVLFALYLVLALISPSALGMGDVKLAGLLGLHLGWLGWDAVLLGAAAGFVVQALLSLVLLAARRIDLRGELPFGPAMLAGAVLAIGAGALS
jgi:leader peptidase (prepilin peptidase) / N-methyltransferase